jgi:hypothetical protein
MQNSGGKKRRGKSLTKLLQEKPKLPTNFIWECIRALEKDFSRFNPEFKDLLKVFNIQHEDGSLKTISCETAALASCTGPDSESLSLFRSLSLLRLGEKYTPDGRLSTELTASAASEFIQREQEMKSFDIKGLFSDPWVRPRLFLMKRFIWDVLGKEINFDDVAKRSCHGPGANVLYQGRVEAYFKFANMTCTKKALGLLRRAILSDSLFLRALLARALNRKALLDEFYAGEGRYSSGVSENTAEEYSERFLEQVDSSSKWQLHNIRT